MPLRQKNTFPLFAVATLGTDCNDDSDCLEEKSRCVYNNYMKNPRRKCMCNHNAEYDQATKQCVTRKACFVPYLFLISPSFGASGGLSFEIVTFSVYLHLYF